MNENELRRLGEQIHGELPDLVPDPQERAVVAADLVRALAQPSGAAEAALASALRSHPAVRDRLGVDIDRVGGLPGDPTGEIGVLYVCPQRDYSLVREVVAAEWPICPNDGTPLERYAG
jgi:hypothetical protein